MPHTVQFEQAVYGSFPFWDKGYAVLARSPGCRAEWLDGFCAACQKFGERPGGVAEFAGAKFSLRFSEYGPWMVVGVSTPGADDRGRPDAMAFHGLFVEEREFRKVGYDPFVLAPALRTDWEPGTTLGAGAMAVSKSSGPPVSEQGEVHRIAAVLSRGKRVAIEAERPIEDLARSVWGVLPERVRRRASVATWAFANGNGFDLLASPRLAGMDLDASYVDPSASEAPRRESRPFPARLAFAAAALVTLAGSVALALRGGHVAPATTSSSAPQQEVITPTGPNPSAYREGSPDADEVRAVARGLADWARRFDVPIEDTQGPTAMMIALAARLRYIGPLLTEAERSKLAADPSPGHSRALAWDAHIRHFTTDRSLPRGFANGPFRWKLDTLAWSFGVEVSPTLAASEIPPAIADALAMEEPVGSNPLAAKYPALGEYAKFLQRLPGR